MVLWSERSLSSVLVRADRWIVMNHFTKNHDRTGVSYF